MWWAFEDVVTTWPLYKFHKTYFLTNHEIAPSNIPASRKICSLQMIEMIVVNGVV